MEGPIQPRPRDEQELRGFIENASASAHWFSEKRYRTLFDLAPVAVYSCDASGVIREYNNRAAELWGRRPEPGDTDERFCGSFKLYRPDGSFMPHEQCPMGDVLSGKVSGTRDAEVHIERPDGSRIIVIVNIAPLTDGEEITGAINCFYDVTERKRAEEAKAKLAASLQEEKDKLESRVQDRTHELQNQVLETKRAEENLRTLTARLFQVQDEERRRMARELHDSAGQTLVALSLNLSAMQAADLHHDGLDKKVAESKLLVDSLTKEIRTLSYLLHPPLLDESGLESALRWYIEGFSERSSIEVDLELGANFGRIPDDLELAIFRLVQESLTNIHRHSGSSSAKVRILRCAGQVELEISDKGKGISAERQRELTTAKSGVGVRGMQERVRQVGGALTVTSNGNGTCVAATLPIAHSVAVAGDDPIL